MAASSFQSMRNFWKEFSLPELQVRSPQKYNILFIFYSFKCVVNVHKIFCTFMFIVCHGLNFTFDLCDVVLEFRVFSSCR